MFHLFERFHGLHDIYDIHGFTYIFVCRAATGQSIKGMFTVGVVKGCVYALNKVKKRLFPVMKTA